ncbi:MAG: hypothetical protein J7K04_16775 [Spirochaetales bacterium]|nr:hypothetical protein [Spirochaetales bacterium]
MKNSEIFNDTVNFYKSAFKRELKAEQRGSFISGTDIDRAVENAKELRRKRRKHLWIGSIAAAAVFSIGIIGGNLARSRAEDSRLVAESTSVFVDSLYSKPLFAGVEYSPADETLNFFDWIMQVGVNSDIF